MKGLLIFPIYTDLSSTDAILIKNEGIRSGFLNNGVDVEVLEFTSKGVFNQQEMLTTFGKGRALRSYDFYFRVWKTISDYVVKRDYDFIWLRLPLINPAIANCIRTIKIKKPGCAIILEYGAYPFEKELTRKSRLFYKINKPYEKLAHRHADFLITYCGQEEVDQVPNIPIDNGIDLSKVPVVHPPPNVDQAIHFISVSSLKKWHAYERFVAGLPGYLERPDAVQVHFHIVGNGPELQTIKNMVNQYGLGEVVTFHLFKSGKELDEIYGHNHVAIGTLGFHRIGITNSSSLKNREYFARGLPVVLSTKDKDMPAGLPYVQYIPEGEDPVDIASIVRFAQQVYARPGINQAIRSYAEKTVSWDSKIRTVLAYLPGRAATVVS